MTIVGMLRLNNEQYINLAFVQSIYKDRFKTGYWIRSRVAHKDIKIYTENTTPDTRGIIKRAGDFNQTVSMYLELH